MKKFSLLMALCALTLLTGCGNLLPPKPIVQTRNVFITPSAALTQDCPISAPPTKEAFLQASEAERQQLLTKYSVALLGDLKGCNTQWATLRQWEAEQQQIYTKGNPK